MAIEEGNVTDNTPLIGENLAGKDKNTEMQKDDEHIGHNSPPLEIEKNVEDEANQDNIEINEAHNT